MQLQAHNRQNVSMKRIFRNKKTGKFMELDEELDMHLISTLIADEDYQELITL